MESIKENELQFVARLLELGESKSFQKGQVVYREADHPLGLYYIQSGLVGLVKTSMAGNESLLRVFKPKQFFGHRTLFSEETYHGSAKCLEDTQLAFIEKTKVFELFNAEPSAYYFLARALAKELRRAENRSLLISEGHIKERVAYALILFKKLYPEHLWTRTEIANYCATRTPTVIKALGELEDTGAIRQNRRHIEILDEEALLDVVEERV